MSEVNLGLMQNKNLGYDRPGASQNRICGDFVLDNTLFAGEKQIVRTKIISI